MAPLTSVPEHSHASDWSRALIWPRSRHCGIQSAFRCDTVQAKACWPYEGEGWSVGRWKGFGQRASWIRGRSVSGSEVAGIASASMRLETLRERLNKAIRSIGAQQSVRVAVSDGRGLAPTFQVTIGGSSAADPTRRWCDLRMGPIGANCLLNASRGNMAACYGYRVSLLCRNTTASARSSVRKSCGSSLPWSCTTHSALALSSASAQTGPLRPRARRSGRPTPWSHRGRRPGRSSG